MNFPATPIDLFQFPSRFRGDVQIFHANNLSTISYQQWIKPRGVSMSYMVCIGGGGGGGGGRSAPSGNTGGGGGGGACSGISRLVVPTFLLPDSLYIQVGVGGLGGGASTNGGAGTNSYIMLSPLSFVAQNSLLSSNTNAPGGGGGADAGGFTTGAGGTAPTIATATVLSAIGQFSADVGLVGAAGGAVGNGAGVSVTAWGTIPLSPGAGGGGANNTNSDGGSQTAASAINFTFINWPTTAGAVAKGGTGGTTSANIGDPGVSLMAPFIQSGGAGGGTNLSGTAGNGGKGGIGCGGGGGGKGATAGRGGDGGNGIVAIFSW
jgi:hypothetical protein